MILREFDFYSDSSPEVTRKLRDELRFLCALYERLFESKLQTDGIWKLTAKLVSRSKADASIGLVAGVAIVEVGFGAEKLLALVPSLQRYQRALDLLLGASLHAAESFGWPQEPFEEAYRRVIESDFRNEWVWKGSKWSPNRKLRAEVSCEHLPDAFLMRLQLKDRLDNVQVLKVIRTAPSEFVFASYFGSLKWLPGGTLRWSSVDSEVLWEGPAL